MMDTTYRGIYLSKVIDDFDYVYLIKCGDEDGNWLR